MTLLAKITRATGIDRLIERKISSNEDIAQALARGENPGEKVMSSLSVSELESIRFRADDIRRAAQVMDARKAAVARIPGIMREREEVAREIGEHVRATRERVGADDLRMSKLRARQIELGAELGDAQRAAAAIGEPVYGIVITAIDQAAEAQEEARLDDAAAVGASYTSPSKADKEVSFVMGTTSVLAKTDANRDASVKLQEFRERTQARYAAVKRITGEAESRGDVVVQFNPNTNGVRFGGGSLRDARYMDFDNVIRSGLLRRLRLSPAEGEPEEIVGQFWDALRSTILKLNLEVAQTRGEQAVLLPTNF